MLDNDTYLMISIFQKSAEVGESEPVEPEEYLDQYKDQIKAVGVLFEYLGLAKSKPKSPLGWKPTGLLVKFIAERVCNEGAKEEPVGNAFLVTLMMDAAFGSSDKDSRVLAQRLLH